MKITFLGNAAMLVSHEGKSVIIDPYLTGNPLATMKQE